MIKETFSETDTRAFGEMLGRKAVPGTVYTLTGDLGVGKTYLPRDSRRAWASPSM